MLKKKYLFVYFSLFLLLSLSFVLPKFFAKAQSSPRSLPEVVALYFPETTFNTEDSPGTLVTYVRIRGEEGVNDYIEANIRPLKLDITDRTDHENNIFNGQRKKVNFQLMTGTCDTLPSDFREGLDGCGDEYDGIYRAEVTFPQYSATGDWRLHITSMACLNPGKNGQKDNYEWVEHPPITNEATVEDVTGPVISEWSFSPEEIDTTDIDVNVTLEITLSDDNGLSFEKDLDNSEYLEIFFYAEKDTKESKSLRFKLFEKSGNKVEGSATLKKYSASGDWRPGTDAYIADSLGNPTFFDELESSFAFTNHATEYDITPPVIEEISLSPTHFNTKDGPVEITATLKITDNVSGVQETVDKLGEDYVLVINSLIGESQAKFVDYQKKENDMYEIKVEIPQNATPGLWYISSIRVFDNADNMLEIRGFRDLSLTFPDLELFLINQDLSDEVVIEDDWYISEDEDYDTTKPVTITHPAMSVKFFEGTKITKKEGGSFALYRMLTKKYSLIDHSDLTSLLSSANTDLAGDLQDCNVEEKCINSQLNSSNLQGQPLHLVKMGIAGLKLEFSKPVEITIAVDEKYLGRTFIIQTFDIEKNEWINETSCTIEMVEPESYEKGGNHEVWYEPAPFPACRFYVTHATHFSTNILGVETDETTTEKAGVPKTGLGGSYWADRYLK